MIVDHAHKYILVSVPKTGSISLQFTLGYGHDIPEPEYYHMGLPDILNLYPECSHYFKFGFVRNPWARLVSLYHDFTVKRVYQYSALVKREKPLLSEFTDFADMCKRIHESEWIDDIFFRSQSKLLGASEGSRMTDFIGRFETLKDDFEKACRLIGIDTQPLESRNTGEYTNRSYRAHYTDETAEIIGKLYADDVANFGYAF